ncbi:ankyrin repeat-containing domain protein [Limtongia smithiae]|uniref:ankyrin repeat-containing domain protein n=1 Tax=Limtongia smithiae TaxID=1125753 RepID=UPI0034CDBE16
MTSNYWIAASDNNIPAVRAYLATGSHTANDQDPNGYTALHAAASYSHLDLLRFLVSEGGNVNITDDDGETPLFTVENVEVAKVLVEEFKADWRHTNSAGQTARQKLEQEIEEDGEPWEDVVAYLRDLEGQQTDNLEDEIRREIQADRIIQSGDFTYSFQRQNELADEDMQDPEVAERREKIAEILRSENPEDGIKKLVENAVRLQLAEVSSSEELSDRSVRPRTDQ